MAADPAIFTRKRTLTLVATAATYVLAAVVVYLTIDTKAVEKTLSLPLSLLALMLALSLVNYALRAWRWMFLTRHLNLSVPAYSNGIYYIAGYALTATPGKAGEAIRLWLLKTGHSIAYAQSLPLMLADRIVDLWAILALSLLSMSGFAAYLWQAIAVGSIVMILSIPILFPKVLIPVLRLAYSWVPRYGRLIVHIRKIIHSLADAVGLRAYGLTLAPTIAGWFAECMALYLVLAHFEANVGIAGAVFVFSFSMLVGAISMLPGGLGSTEATMVILLKALGVELDDALAATAIVRFTTFWFAVVLGLVCTPTAINMARQSSRLLTPRPVVGN